MTNEDHDSGSLFEGRAPAPPETEPKSKGLGGPAKVAIVAALVVVVVGVIVLKQKSAGQKESGTQPASADATSGQTGAGIPAFAGETILAAVGSEQITLREFEDALKALPAEYRSEFERQKDAFLEELITRKLLLQQARASKIAETQAYRDAMGEHEAHPGHEEHVLIDVLLRTEVLDKVQVSDADLRAFYEEYKDQLPGQPSFEKAQEQIRPSVEQQKQYEAFEAYLAKLKEDAKISRNAEWVEAQKRAAADNPLDRALQSGKPVLADFGRGTCIPCKMMKPILDKMADEFKGRIHVLILDTGEYGYLARRHRIRVIPTQIFFSAEGKELFRHEGFMSREDMLAKMNELQMTPRQAR